MTVFIGLESMDEITLVEGLERRILGKGTCVHKEHDRYEKLRVFKICVLAEVVGARAEETG